MKSDTITSEKVLSENVGPPSLITVFSCPNYGGRYGNKAGLIFLTDNDVTPLSFNV